MLSRVTGYFWGNSSQANQSSANSNDSQPASNVRRRVVVSPPDESKENQTEVIRESLKQAGDVCITASSEFSAGASKTYVASKAPYLSSVANPAIDAASRASANSSKRIFNSVVDKVVK